MFHRVVPKLAEENVTSKMIVAECEAVLRIYDSQCQQSAAGAEGVDRRQRFVDLKNELAKRSPRDAMIALYDFYANEKQSSRLTNQIEKGLYHLVGIRVPVMTTNLTRNVREIGSAEGALKDKIDQLKQAREQEYQSMTSQKKMR